MRSLAGLILFAATLVGGPLSAQQRPQQFLPTNRLLRSRPVRAAFQEAIAPSRQWTVEVQYGEKRIAYGAVVAADGKLVTKLSVLQEAQRPRSSSKDDEDDPPAKTPKNEINDKGVLQCRLFDGRTLKATLIAENEQNDLALLQIPASNLPVIAWADSPGLELGRWVVSAAVRGDAPSVGIISSRRRKVGRERTPGILGVRVKSGEGPAVIEEVFEQSAAAQAGIATGDVIQRLGTTDIVDGQALVRYVKRHQPGDVVQVMLRRGEETKTVDVTLTHPFGDFLSQFAQQIRMGGELSDRRSGFDDVFSQDGLLKPQDCGGPLVNLSGAAVGLNIARASRTETLVLPADVVQRVVSEMLTTSQTAATNDPGAN